MDSLVEGFSLLGRDIVKAVDSTPIRSAAQLRNLIGLMPLGSRANLRLERNGNSVSASVDAGPARASAPQHAGN
jgi:serine protease Do